MILYSNSVMPFGKYKGQIVDQIPEIYKEWLRENTKHTIVKQQAPAPVKFTEEERIRLYFAKLDETYRLTCTKIGRKLIYENIEIPF